MTESMQAATPDKRSTLFLFGSAPQDGTDARDGLDTLLAFAAFDVPVAVVFLGDGVFQLCGNQVALHAEQKTPEKALQVLPMYDVNDIYILDRSLTERGLVKDQLFLGHARIVDDADLRLLLERYDRIFRF